MEELKALLTAISKKRKDGLISINIFNDGSGGLVDEMDFEILEFNTTEEMFEKLKTEAEEK